MPEQPVNAPLSSQEVLEHVFRRVERYLEKNVCESCALRLVSHDYGLDYKRLLVMWLDRDHHGNSD